MDAFFDCLQGRIDGNVRSKMYKGSMRIVGRGFRSNSDQIMSKGLTDMFGLSIVMANRVRHERNGAD